MKTAKEWQEQLNGETSVQALTDIQMDALIFASMCLIHGNKQTALDEIIKKCDELQRQRNQS